MKDEEKKGRKYWVYAKSIIEYRRYNIEIRKKIPDMIKNRRCKIAD